MLDQADDMAVGVAEKPKSTDIGYVKGILGARGSHAERFGVIGIYIVNVDINSQVMG